MKSRDLLFLGAGYLTGRYMKRTTPILGVDRGVFGTCADAGRNLALCRWGKKKGKIKAKEVKIHWSEMPGVGENKVFKSISAANEYLRRLFAKNYGNTGQGWRGGGYDKTKFTIKFQDGEDYEGRLDLNLKEDNPLKPDLIGKHIVDFVTYYINNPQNISPKELQEYKDFLNNYDLFS